MPETFQPVAGTLEATVIHACHEEDCPHYLSRDCPDHASTEDLGVVAGWDNREVVPNGKG